MNILLKQLTWSAARHSHHSIIAHPPRVLIVDAMAVLHGIKKTCNKRELQNTFIKLTESKIDSYSEGRVIYDHYLDQSLKVKTRQKRVSTWTEFAVYREMKLTMSMKELLSSSKTKHHLTCMFAEGLLEHLCGKMNIKLVVTFYNKIKNHDFEETH